MSDDTPATTAAPVTVPAPANVLVSAERLAELERLERELPAIIAKAKAEGGTERLRMLHKKAKENPEESSAKALKRYYKNKDEINARRREAYRLKKEAKTE